MLSGADPSTRSAHFGQIHFAVAGLSAVASVNWIRQPRFAIVPAVFTFGAGVLQLLQTPSFKMPIP